MKKLLFLISMLCSMTAAWAGEGNGTKEHPYKGEWTVNDLLEELKNGDHLDYNCVIKGSSVQVSDTKVNYTFIENWKEWAVGAPISKNPFKCYTEYCKWNSEYDRPKQTFIVTSFSRSRFDANGLVLEGHYSGFYTQHEAEGYIPVTTASELKSVIQKNKAAKVLLCADINISGLGTICDKFTGTISGGHIEFNTMLDTLVTNSYILKGSGYVKDLTKNDAKDTYLFESVENATFEYLVFQNISVKKSSDDVGVIALTATNTTFRAICMDHVTVYDGDDNAGTFVGTANGCHFTGAFVNYSEVYTGGYNSGGMVGKSNSSEYTSCIVYVNSGVYADGTVMTGFMEGVDARAGGLVGGSTNDQFFSCMNQAFVGGLCDGLGGIAGYSDGSRFVNCMNYGNVCHCEYTGEGKKMFFRASVDNIRDRLKNMTNEQVEEILDAVEAGCYTALGTIVAIGIANSLVYLATDFSIAHNMLCVTADYCMAMGMDWSMAAAYAGVASGIAFLIVAAAVAGAIIYDVVTDYDNVGGICGETRNSSFEMCSNFADLRNDDESGGGIVGYGYYVTINNCYNSGRVYHDGSTLNGGIIGTINCGKVTNCVSVAEIAQPIIGGAWGEHTAWIDQTSGNNYRLRGGRESDVPDFEREVSKELLGFGIVASWLNDGVENREKGIRPWHQNLWKHEGYSGKVGERDRYPVLDATHDEVNADLFYGAAAFSPYVHRIHDADGLKAFADFINSGNSTNERQFHIGYLEDDIDMTNVDWTPIGKNEDYKNFRGIFNGRGHKITGLTCSSTNQPVGLVGTAFANAQICNVTIGDGSSFTCSGDAGAGGIVGMVNIHGRDWGTVVIENCGSHADVNGNKHVGGILGRIEASANENIKVYVNNCYSTGTITAENGNSALLCGYTQHSGNIRNCWSSGQLRNGKNKSIWPYSWENDKNEAECLVGYSNNTINIKDCYIANPETKVDRYGEKPLQAGVTIIDERSLAYGEFAYDFNKKSGKDVLQQNIGTDPHPVHGNRGLYHTRKVSNQYGTVCLPFTVKSDDKISYYKLKGATEGSEINLKFEYVDEVLSGIPALFRAAEVTDVASAESPVEICFNDAGIDYLGSPYEPWQFPKWHMHGTFENKVFEGDEAKTIYYVSNGEVRNAKKVNIAPFRAYIHDSLNGSDGTAAKAVTFSLEEKDGTTTEIRLVYDNENDNPMHNAEFIMHNYYNLNGQRVNANHKGIVIKNGKKVIQ